MTVSVTIFHHCCNGDKHHRMIQSIAVHLLSVSSVLARQTTISSLKITDRSFRYASSRLWNQLPDSLHHHHHHFVGPVSIHLLIHLSTRLCYHPHTHHPSLFHSFTPGSKPTFSTNPYHLNRLLLPIGLPFPDNGTGPDLSRLSVYF